MRPSTPVLPQRQAASRHRPARALFAALVGLLISGPAAAAPQESGAAVGGFQAPTRLFAAPSEVSLATLPGNSTQMRYTLGALDRAARIQLRLEGMMRLSSRWAQPGTLTVYVLSRQEWATERIRMPYGVPIRVGPSGLAIPALGDTETARLWSNLGFPLPSAPANVFYRGGAGDAPSEVMADVLGLVLAGEVLADRNGLAGDQFWVRGVVSHLVSYDYLRREEEGLLRDMDVIYRQILNDRGPKALAASDYRPEMGIRDWMWFQANFHFGAKAIVDDEGRGVFKKISKMRRRNGGVVTGAAMLDRWDEMRAWYESSFSAISQRPQSANGRR